MLLEKEGLVEIPPRRRPRVSHVSLEEVEELYQIRVALNGLMIASFVRNADDEHMIQMNPLHERSEEHTSELQSLMRISYAVFCLQKKKYNYTQIIHYRKPSTYVHDH